MDDESAKCRSCGAELQGRDVYEGVCKACREEAALGAPAATRRPRSPKRRPPPFTPTPGDAIAIETSVDLEADTKEMSPEERAAEEAARRAAEPEFSPGEPAEPAAEDQPAVPIDSDVIPFSFGPSDASPPPAAAEAPPAEPPAAPGPAIRHLDKTLAGAPGAGPAGGIKRSYESFHGDSEAPGRLARPSAQAPALEPEARPEPLPALRPLPRIELPPSQEAKPPAPPAQPLSLPGRGQGEGGDKARPSPIPLPEREGGAGGERFPLVARTRESAPKLQADALEGRIKTLLDDFSGQVEQLSRVLSSAYQVSPNPFWFGFKAFFGFLVGMGAVAAVALGLLALAALFYPPAFDLLRQIFGGSGPP